MNTNNRLNWLGLLLVGMLAVPCTADVNITVSPPSKTTKKKADTPAPATLPPMNSAMPIIPTFTAQGGFETTLERARQSAILIAKEKFHEHLHSQEESIAREPSTELIRRMLISSLEKIETTPIKSDLTGKTEDMYRVTVAVKVESEHMRLMRTRDRSSEALGVIGILAMGLFVLACFFKLDTMTKGYITRWLFLSMIGIGTLALGIWGYHWPW